MKFAPSGGPTRAFRRVHHYPQPGHLLYARQSRRSRAQQLHDSLRKSRPMACRDGQWPRRILLWSRPARQSRIPGTHCQSLVAAVRLGALPMPGQGRFCVRVSRSQKRARRSPRHAQSAINSSRGSLLLDGYVCAIAVRLNKIRSTPSKALIVFLHLWVGILRWGCAPGIQIGPVPGRAVASWLAVVTPRQYA